MMHLSIINTNLKPFSPSYYYIYFNVIVSYSCKSNYHAIPASTPPFIVMLAVNDTLHDILTWLTVAILVVLLFHAQIMFCTAVISSITNNFLKQSKYVSVKDNPVTTCIQLYNLI